MSDYIGREELWKKLDALERVDTGDETDAVLRVDALLAVESLPAADVKPVRWIPVEEQLPAPFQHVIVCREKKGSGLVVEAGMRDVAPWWRVYGTRTKAVRYWMPLPEAPNCGADTREG